MSDTGRKTATETLKEKIVPESLKSDTQKVKEGTTSATDKVVRDAQLDQTKSTTQKAMDVASGTKDDKKLDSTKY